MSKLLSPGGLLELEQTPQDWRIQSLPIPWQHPSLRPVLLKLGLLALLAAGLGALEGLGLLQLGREGLPGLFPALLGLAALLQLVSLNRQRQHGLRLELRQRQLSIWEGDLSQEQEPSQVLVLPQRCQLELGYQTTSRTRTRPALLLSPEPDTAVYLGGGLPESELRWLLDQLKQALAT